MDRHDRRFWFGNATLWGAYTLAWLSLGIAFLGVNSGLVLIHVVHGSGLFLATGALRAMALHRGWLQRDAVGLVVRMLAGSAVIAALVQVAIALVLLPSLAQGWVEVPGGQANYQPGTALMYWLNTFVSAASWSIAWVGWRAIRRARRSEEVSRRQGRELRERLAL